MHGSKQKEKEKSSLKSKKETEDMFSIFCLINEEHCSIEGIIQVVLER